MKVRRADLTDGADAAAVVHLVDAYARDPLGGATPLGAEVRARLIPGLRAHPTTCVWLAFADSRAVGVCVAFTGFSTFEGRPLLNIHDLAVLPGSRGAGVGRALLAAAQAHARASGYCKLTLEVLQDNPARRLYERFGFRDMTNGSSEFTRFMSMPLAD